MKDYGRDKKNARLTYKNDGRFIYLIGEQNADCHMQLSQTDHRVWLLKVFSNAIYQLFLIERSPVALLWK